MTDNERLINQMVDSAYARLAEGKPDMLDPVVIMLILDGDRIVEVLSMIPDFKNLTGSVKVTLLTRYYPHDSEEQVEVGIVTATTTRIDTRASGRQSRVKVESDILGSDWRLGVVRFDLVPGGNR